MKDDPIIRISAKPPAGGQRQGKQKAKGLGRGLGALLGDSRRDEPLAMSASAGEEKRSGDGLAMLAVSDIDPHPNQPRRQFDEAALEELAASITQRGVIQPVIVRESDGRYQLVAGERRWRAAQRAQLHQIPALIRDLSDRDVMALALIENLQREDLNPIEEARAFQRLADSERLTQAEIAKMVDKSRSHVANLQRLLSLPDEVIGMVEQGGLSMGHARALVGSEDALAIARDVLKRRLSVREVEKRVRNKPRSDGARQKTPARRDQEGDADILAVEGHLEEFLGMPVRITAGTDPRTGTVTIRYATLDQLDFICQRLTGGEI
ncbi:MAG: ParB/RepB/Spo0J family partition protein [Novosphingobium sp.]|nr:ParB/RepB/Spo0J family partition protein [Novosphingobium sp.]